MRPGRGREQVCCGPTPHTRSLQRPIQTALLVCTSVRRIFREEKHYEASLEIVRSMARFIKGQSYIVGEDVGSCC